MKILLAPMEGVVDSHMRRVLTGLGGFDHCVTEFIRVVDRPLPERVFYRMCPELYQDGRTESGVPVTIQLLGADVEAMAANAATAARLGAHGVDVNFGCPSKIVNRRQGGAVLLQYPDRLEQIVAAVRKAVPQGVPVSAKIRLGYEDTELALHNARAVAAAGADFVVVHARTKADGYKAPARWEWLARIREAIDIPVVANGDINSVADYQRCIAISGCEQIMLGRGAIARPDLARQIRALALGETDKQLDWARVRELMLAMVATMDNPERQVVPRLKQWLVYLRHEFVEAAQSFERIRTLKGLTEVTQQL